MLRTHSAIRRNGKFLALSVACLLTLIVLPVATPRAARAQEAQMPVPFIAPGSAYRQTNLISDSPGLAPVLDPLLVNPWGLASRSGGPLWVANNGSRTAQQLRGIFGGSGFVLDESLPTVSINGGRPMALVANTTGDFNITPTGGSPAPAHFILSLARQPVDGMGGHLAAWQPASGNTVQVFGPTSNGILYTGLAIGGNAGGNRLYAARFPQGVEVFDAAFTPTTVPGSFLDPTIPADYFPYNIQNLEGSLYVTYAKRGAANTVSNGQGQGLVRKFDTNGVRDPNFSIDDGPTSQLNAPWGMAIAPASFGIFNGALLVGNSSDRAKIPNPSGQGGRINAYDKTTGEYLGTLQNEGGVPVEIDGLRALTFGGGGEGGDPDTLYFTTGFANGLHGLFGALNPTTASATSLIEFGADEYVTGEGGHIDVTVTRSGVISSTAQVNYATFEDSPPFSLIATQKGDYQLALGTLTFNPGETSKTFRLLIPNDTYSELEERIVLALSNPSSFFPVGLGGRNIARVKLVANDQALPETITPVHNSSSFPELFTAFFVRQQYLDFLNREPDAAGLSFWMNEIESCGGDMQCRELKRSNVSAAFFLSIEFQQTGMLAYLANRSAFGARPLYGEFMRDAQALQRNVVFGQPGAAEQLAANKADYFQEFVNRLAFADKYPTTLTPAQFVDALFANFSTTNEERLAAIDEFGSAAATSDSAARARVLRRAAEHPDFARREFNAAFVTMEYFGYLRRDPDEAGFQFWLSKLNAANGNFIQAQMVEAFINSIEYRTRFGPHSTG